MTNAFNYKVHRIAVAIYQYADFSVNTPEHMEYANTELSKALETGISWLPKFESYKGSSAKRKGTATVSVEMSDGYAYGFYMPLQKAESIYNILHAKWMEIYSQGN